MSAVQSDTGGSDLYKTDGGGTNTLSLSSTPENVSSRTILSFDFERKYFNKEKYLDFLKLVNPNGINIDFDVDPGWAKENFKNVCIQGGMDPKNLLLNDKELFRETKKYLKTFENSSYIFNLGHGILPKTNPEKVRKLIKFIKEYKYS